MFEVKVKEESEYEILTVFVNPPKLIFVPKTIKIEDISPERKQSSSISPRAKKRKVAVSRRTKECVETSQPPVQTRKPRKSKYQQCCESYDSKRINSHSPSCCKTNPRFSCDHCKYRARTRNLIEGHVLCHMKYRPLVCNICDRGFIEKRYFREHMLNHQTPNPFKCNLCGNAYTRKTSIIRHMHTMHNEDRRFKCSQCTYAGKTKNDLTTHIKSHTHAFVCEVCSRAFSRSSLLRQHAALHVNPNAYQCATCKKNYAQKKSMKRHVMSKHPEVKIDYKKRKQTAEKMKSLKNE